MKLVTVIGARPQFIKAAPVSKAIAAHPTLNEVIIHTGQHFDTNMSDIFFKEMAIPMPDYKLDIHSLSHGAMTGRMLDEIEKILLIEKPDFVLVYGDTNSTLAGALAAAKLHIKVIHIEAGLRSFNMQMPEEINRILTDRISSVLFCPTDIAIKNLETEGFKHFDCKIIKSGDVMYDAMLTFSQVSSSNSTIINDLHLDKYVLCTLHRQENTDDLNKLKSIIMALNKIHKEIQVVLPLHPRTTKIMKNNGLQSAVKIIEPVGYLDMIELVRHSRLILTDSGGLQKEAYFLKKNCVTLREQTEWVELVDNGFNVLAGSDENKIYVSYQKMINIDNKFEINLYGDGRASDKIAGELAKYAEY